jgi:actin-related protein 3
MQNIVLSGGSTMFKDFGRRLQRDIKRAVDQRMERNMAALANFAGTTRAPAIDVNVISHHMQRWVLHCKSHADVAINVRIRVRMLACNLPL